MRCVCLTRARAVNEYAYCMAALHSSAAHAAMPIYQTLLPFLLFPNFRRGLCGSSGNETRQHHRCSSKILAVRFGEAGFQSVRLGRYFALVVSNIFYKFIANSLFHTHQH